MNEQVYGEALRVAIESATTAAGTLRAACRQPGGPGGNACHCPTDQEVEQVIRTRLSGAFPEWGYRGEETRPHVGPRDAAAHVWVVDPNDGTSAMQRGFRGHAVSIGLVRGGVPVLGVVCAPTAPDDGGDLIAWAEGCGPLTRNGQVLEPPAWPHALTASAIVLVSQDADRHPSGNLACVAPARFGAVPGIAYRLALVAAGDAVAGVSLNGAGDWDYCAGHALLRGVGGILVDERGQEVSYDRDGRSSTAACFGGAPDIVRHLARQNWRQVWGSGFGAAAPPPGYEPTRLRPGQHVHDVGVLRRAHGCLLGQVAGDALGSLVEFQGPGAIARQYPDGPRALVDGGVWDTLAGQPTDDSELALLLARSLLDPAEVRS